MPIVAGLAEHTPSLWSEPAELAVSFLCAPRCPLVWAALLLKSNPCTSWDHSPLYGRSPTPLLLLGPPRLASAWWGGGLMDASREPGSRDALPTSTAPASAGQGPPGCTSLVDFIPAILAPSFSFHTPPGGCTLSDAHRPLLGRGSRVSARPTA